MDFTTFLAGVVLGLPAGLMAVVGVPNEFSETCGVSQAESRTIFLGVATLLAWGVYLAFCIEGSSSIGLPTDAPDAVTNFSNGEQTQ